MASSAVRVLIAASGTGGHLIPALHIAHALQAAAPGVQIEFIGSGRPLEQKIIAGAGFRINVISAAGIKRLGLRGLIRSLVLAPKAVLQVFALFRRFKPNLVIGVGGYVTFLPVTIARVMRVPTWIHEAELQPGMANAILACYATRVSVAFERSSIRAGARRIFTGHPVRPELLSVPPANVETGGQGPDPVSAGRPRKILVLGGSQGADALDRACVELAALFRERELEVLHQCRAENMKLVEDAYRAAGVSARVIPFIEDMPAAYAWCDLILGRAGAGAVMEIAIVNRPAILVPYPFAQGDHQAANAATLVERHKAIMVRENAGSGDFVMRLRDALETILSPERYQSMLAAEAARRVDAAQIIARESLALVKV